MFRGGGSRGGGVGALAARRETAAHAGARVPRPGDVPHRPRFMGTQVGGLSGIAYDEARGVYYSLSDDPSQFGPARYYTLAVDLGDGRSIWATSRSAR